LTNWLSDENVKRTEKSSSTRNLPHLTHLTQKRWWGRRRASPSGKVEAKTSSQNVVDVFDAFSDDYVYDDYDFVVFNYGLHY
jgi:hypothetical protein